LYAAVADAAAEGTLREALARECLAGDILLERCDPPRQAWLPAGGAGRARVGHGMN